MNSNKNPTMPCPGCNSILQFDTADLLKGKKIKCDHCGTIIGLDNNSKDTLSEALVQRNKIMNDRKANNLDSDQ